MCFTTSSYPRYKGDPAGSFIHELARHLVNGGHRVCVVAPHYPGAKRCEIIDEVSVYRFKYFMPATQQRLAYGAMYVSAEQQPVVAFQLIPYILSMMNEALKVCKEQNVEIVISFWAFPQGLVCMMIKRLLGLPFVVRLFPVEVSLSLNKYTIAIPILKLILSNADLVIPNSNYTKNLMRKLQFSVKNVLIVREGVDIKRFNSSISGDEVRLLHNLKDEFLLLTVARLIERKGIKYLVQAMKHILQMHPDTVLIIVGEGPQRSKLTSLTERLDIDKNVIFIGRVSDKDLPHYYAAADAFVLPAIVDSRGDTEGLGVVLLEAMATGKPVIASNVGGIPEVVVDGKTGILVHERDSQTLSKAIIDLIENSDRIQMFGRNARLHVTENFGWTRITKEFEESLRRCLRRSCRTKNWRKIKMEEKYALT